MISTCTTCSPLSCDLFLTPQEALFVSCIQQIIEQALQTENNFVIIPATSEMQQIFNAFVKAKHRSMKRDLLHVDCIVNGLWTKVRKEVQEEEINLLKADMISQKHTRAGRVFTRAQALALLSYNKNICITR